MTVTYRDFIHPEDDRARRELEAVPGFDVVTKCFLKFCCHCGHPVMKVGGKKRKGR